MECRDLFRLELTRTSLTLFVNGVKYFEQTGIPPLPDKFFNGELFVYFASVVVSHPAEAIRFHWDDIRVNPDTHISLMEETISVDEEKSTRESNLKSSCPR